MSVADVAAVDAALVARLAGDAQLQALVPDGVYLGFAASGLTRFVLVEPITHDDTEGFRAPLYETFLYAVTARVRLTSGVDVDAAAFRIHTLLQDQVLTVAGYTHMATLRSNRIRYPEPGAQDNDIRWQVAGAVYEIVVSPT